MNPISKKIYQASAGFFVLLAFQVNAHSSPPDHAALKAAAEACALELNMSLPPPPPHHGDRGTASTSASNSQNLPSQEDMAKFDACMSAKGFQKPSAPPSSEDD